MLYKLYFPDLLVYHYNFSHQKQSHEVLLSCCFLFLVIQMDCSVSEQESLGDALRKYIDPEKADAVYKQR